MEKEFPRLFKKNTHGGRHQIMFLAVYPYGILLIVRLLRLPNVSVEKPRNNESCMKMKMRKRICTAKPDTKHAGPGQGQFKVCGKNIRIILSSL